jgi:transcriptional regulator with XRE-family HTH domain
MRRRRSERARLYRSPAFRELAKRLAENVRRLRGARDWTQEQAAERCDIAPRMLQAIEAGEVNATLITLALLATGFAIEASQLLTAPRRR